MTEEKLYMRWTVNDPEPPLEQIVEVDALDCAWKLPWKTVREDAISGLAAVYILEDEFPK